MRIQTNKLKEHKYNTIFGDLPTEEFKALREDIKARGVQNPIDIQEDYTIVCGHQRVRACKELGIEEIEARFLDDLTEEQILEHLIKDNVLRRQLTTEQRYLAIAKLSKIYEASPQKRDESGKFTVDTTLVSTDNVLKKTADVLNISEGTVANARKYEKAIIDYPELANKPVSKVLTSARIKEIGEIEEIEEEIPVTAKYDIKLGETWQLGEHRLLCGDATKKNDVEALMGETKADMVFTDPPYGVSYSEKNEFLNSIDKGNRVQRHIEEDDIKDMSEFLNNVCERIKENVNPVNSVYFTFAGSTLRYLLNSLHEKDFKLHQILVWAKNNHVLGRVDYAYKHELIVYGWFGKHKYYGGFSPSVWEIDKPSKSDLHPTMKPLELCSKAIINSSQENMIVLDLFGGSGSTLIACEQTKRKCFMMEIDPYYCSVIIERWENLTNKKAVKQI